MSARLRPVASSTVTSSRVAMCARNSSSPRVCSARNAWSSTVPGAASSAASTRLDTACSSAMSPPERICRKWSAICVPLPMIPRGFCGFL